MLERVLTLHDQANLYHRLLPPPVRRYLNSLGIPNIVVDRYGLGWDGEQITIPIEDRNGDIAFIRFSTSPFGPRRAVRVSATTNAPVELYGWDTLARQPSRVVICDGELERLVLEAHGFPAVASTGGATSFLAEWAPHFQDIDKVYVCFGRGDSHRRAAQSVTAVIPKAKIVVLPEEVGPSGSVADFFALLKRNRMQFEVLLRAADRHQPSRDSLEDQNESSFTNDLPSAV